MTALLIGLFVWPLGLVSSALAAEVVPTPAEAELLRLINEARANPMQAIARLGLDPEQVVRDLPQMEQILRGGLPALSWNAALSGAARSHTREMFALNYYSSLSPDGRTAEDRIAASGYPAAAAGESLGMIFFANFIKPLDAAALIFAHLFRGELDPAAAAPRRILNPELQDAGLGLGGGSLVLGGQRWNVYLATLDFGAALAPAEAELLRLINEARANPLAAAAGLGINTEPLLLARPDLRAAFEQGLAPLSYNRTLGQTARQHALDMAERNYFATVYPGDPTPDQRIAAAGYDFATAAEAIGIVWVFGEGMDTKEAVGTIFRRMLEREFDAAHGWQAVLDPAMREVGCAFQAGVFKRWDGERPVFLGVCDVAAPKGPVSP